MALDLGRGAGRVGLKGNTNKTKVLSLTGHRTLPICIKGQSIESVYLRSVVSADNRTELNVVRGIKSARSTFAALFKIRKCSYLNTKIMFFASASSMLLYESSTWKETLTVTQKL